MMAYGEDTLPTPHLKENIKNRKQKLDEDYDILKECKYIFYCFWKQKKKKILSKGMLIRHVILRAQWCKAFASVWNF